MRIKRFKTLEELKNTPGVEFDEDGFAYHVGGEYFLIPENYGLPISKAHPEWSYSWNEDWMITEKEILVVEPPVPTVESLIENFVRDLEQLVGPKEGVTRLFVTPKVLEELGKEELILENNGLETVVVQDNNFEKRLRILELKKELQELEEEVTNA